MTIPAAFASQFPPSEHTFRGAITMRLASGGADVDELVEEFIELAADAAVYFPEEAPIAPDAVPGIVDEVVDAYRVAVTEFSPDATGLLTALDQLFEAGILFSYGNAYDASEAMEQLEDAHLHLASEGGQLRGYLYSLIPDLDELVLDQRLDIAFGTFDADSAAVPALAEEAVAILTKNGLAASWSGSVDEPIVVQPMVMNAPLVDDSDEDPEHLHGTS